LGIENDVSIHELEARKLPLLLIAHRAEIRVQTLQVGVDLVELPAYLASLECEEWRTIMLAFHDPSAPFHHAYVGEAIIA
jgi:hypothetical protein